MSVCKFSAVIGIILFFSSDMTNGVQKKPPFHSLFKNVYLISVKSAESPRTIRFLGQNVFWTHFLLRSIILFWNSTIFLIPHSTFLKKKTKVKTTSLKYLKLNLNEIVLSWIPSLEPYHTTTRKLGPLTYKSFNPLRSRALQTTLYWITVCASNFRLSQNENFLLYKSWNYKVFTVI
jgi:hypothetical protein